MVKTLSQKSQKKSTTLRFDPILKSRAESFAKRHHMDFTTFVHFSLESTMKNGAKIEPEMSEEYALELNKMIEKYERGELKATGPFTGKAATDYLKTLY